MAAICKPLQPFATVHNEDAMAVPMRSVTKVVTFGGLKRRVTSFRMAGVALRDIPTCFITCQKSFCVTGSILVHRFQKMTCIFVAGAALFSFWVAGASTLDVWCCVFCKSHCQGRVKW